MNHRSKYRSQAALVMAAMFPILCLTVGSVMADATTSSVTDGKTPVALAPGAPMGAYPLSEFENINLFNGSLNFRLPLLTVQGRGKAKVSVMLPIEKKWRVQHTRIGRNCGQYGCQYYDDYYYPTFDWWAIERKYSPGLLIGRRAGDGYAGCNSPYTNNYLQTITRLTFTASDGTEFELRDQASDGRPQTCTSPISRGHVFVTADGTSATFYSFASLGAEYQNWVDLNDGAFSQPTTFYPTGILALKDGTKYGIQEGLIMWIRDSNGNKLRFEYDPTKRVTLIEDSIKRTVSISYTTDTDTITFKGFGGQQRPIIVSYAALSSRLRSGYSLQTFAQLFPSLNGTTQYCNPLVVSTVTLPDGLQYGFRYNPYVELARVELPTGGAIEYDHLGGLDAGSGVIGSAPGEKAVYRRLVKRYLLPDGANRELQTEYVFSYSSGPPGETYVSVEDRQLPSQQLISRVKNTYWGHPTNSFFTMATAYNKWQEGKETKTEYFKGTVGTTPLKMSQDYWLQGGTVSWWGGAADDSPPKNPRLDRSIQTLQEVTPNLLSKTKYGYDQYNNTTDVWEFDFGSGGQEPTYAKRHTKMSYVTSNLVGGVTKYYDTDQTIHLRNLVKEKWIYDVNPANGAESPKADTKYVYDVYDATTGHAPLVARTGISGLQTGYDTNFKTRGNVTDEQRWRDVPTSKWITTYKQYDVAGNVVLTTDPRNVDYTTTFEYTDKFGTPNGEARTNTPPTDLQGASAFAFVTRIVRPLSMETHAQFDYYMGVAVDEEDANQKVTRTSYDGMGRPRQRIFPPPDPAQPTKYGQIDIYYSDLDLTATHRGAYVFLNRTTVLPLRRKVYTKILDSLDKAELTVFDKLGRVSMAGVSNNAQLDWTRTEYDARGRVLRTSNPISLSYSAAADETPSAGSFTKWTTNEYDPIDRVTKVTSPDSQFVTVAYLGNYQTVTDQTGRPKKSYSDALGRLTSVVEPNQSTGSLTSGSYTTFYTYNVFDKLSGVTQDVQTRTFTYDSLARLVGATHPEWGPETAASGSATYTYDDNSNLTKVTDARGQETRYNDYDALNRPATKRHYNGTETVVNSYYYDTAYGCGSATDVKGRLTKVTDPAGQETYSYDSMGRVVTGCRTFTSGPSLNLTYTYTYSGALKSIAFPGIADGSFALTAVYDYDNGGRQKWLKVDNGTTFTQQIVDGYTMVYSSPGGTEQIDYANNTLEEITYNDRLQPTRRLVSPGLLDLRYNFLDASGKNNGNVWGIEDWVASGQNQVFGYDWINRITSATGPGTRSLTFTYWDDATQTTTRWGNKSQTGTNGAPNKPLTYWSGTYRKNRVTMTDYLYDNAGNMTREAADAHTGRGVMNYTYDAESRVVTSTGGAGTATYIYNSAGQRVKKVSGGQTRYYFYDVTGNPVWEYYGGYWDTLNLTLNGRFIFTRTVPGGAYNYNAWMYLDHLGTPRVKARDTGALIAGSRTAYHPFGEQITATTDAIRYKFTGKERDTESGADYFGARYFASTIGRFGTTDPLLASGVPAMPQSWNRYAYALNNPLKYNDPTGMLWGTPINTYTDKMKKEQEKANKQLSDEGAAFIANYETFSDKVYKCQAGKDTIGYGHVVQKGENFDKGITKEDALKLFKKDTQPRVDALNENLTVDVSQQQFDALISLSFNIGISGLANSSLLKAINGGKEVTGEMFTSWNKITNKKTGKLEPSAGLTSRREDEYEMFTSGDYNRGPKPEEKK